MSTEFDQCTDHSYDSRRHTIVCVLGLWEVSAPSLPLALIEASIYFKQYKADGEYADIIGGKNVIEVLKDQGFL